MKIELGYYVPCRFQERVLRKYGSKQRVLNDL
jgi:hypothetical protein